MSVLRSLPATPAQDQMPPPDTDRPRRASAQRPLSPAGEPGSGEVPVHYWSAAFLIPLAVLLLVVATGGIFLSPYGLTVATQIGIFAIVTLGLNVLVGYTGQISFGHNAFLGVGAYMSALASTAWGLSPLAGMLIGAAAAVVLGIAVGYPTLRLRGHYLALATFAFGIGFYSIAVSSPLFNGFMGIAGIAPFSLGGFTFQTLIQKYALVWGVTVLAVIVTWRLAQLRFGRALRSIAVDESAAQAMGINVHFYKVVAFVASGVYGSVAGSLYAHTVSFVSPESFGFQTIVMLFVMLFVGGLGTVWGSLFGAAAGVALPGFLYGFHGWIPSVFAVVVLVIVVLRPRGLLAPVPRQYRRQLLQRWRRGFAAVTRGSRHD